MANKVLVCVAITQVAACVVSIVTGDMSSAAITGLVAICATAAIG
jgi:hypothetical protein